MGPLSYMRSVVDRNVVLRRIHIYIYIYIYIHTYIHTRVSQMKTLNTFYLVIYWTQKVHNDFIFLCSIVLPPVGQSSNHQYHCWNLQDSWAVVRIFVALLRFSVDFPSYIIIIRRRIIRIRIIIILTAVGFISVINQLDAKNFCFTISLFHCETKILCIKLVNYWDKYTEMQHGQQNVKICNWVVTRWQCLFYVYTKYEIGYYKV